MFRILEFDESTRPLVCVMGGQVMFITTTWIECVFLKGVVQVYSPVSPSSALTMLSLYSRVESLMGPCAQPCIITLETVL